MRARKGAEFMHTAGPFYTVEDAREYFRLLADFVSARQIVWDSKIDPEALKLRCIIVVNLTSYQTGETIMRDIQGFAAAANKVSSTHAT